MNAALLPGQLKYGQIYAEFIGESTDFWKLSNDVYNIFLYNWVVDLY